MREYTEGTRKIIGKMICNQCGKVWTAENGKETEDWLCVDKTWGYFSGKDGERHSFDLCEECYDRLIRGFALPVTVEERKELL